jgi:hypothetical protein
LGRGVGRGVGRGLHRGAIVVRVGVGNELRGWAARGVGGVVWGLVCWG